MNEEANPPNGGGEEIRVPDKSKIERFNTILVESILESIDFGEVVLRFLELFTPVRRDEIAEKPEVFASELENLFGESAGIIEKRIVKNLYAKLGIKFQETAGRNFSDYIKGAMEKCSRRDGILK